MLKLSESNKIDVPSDASSNIDLTSTKFNKMPSNVLIVKPGIHQRALDEEYDIYLFDRLANQLFGIKNLSSHIDKIKKII